jgi:hypothetical protein
MVMGMATCNDCLHNEACVDMLQSLGFVVDGEGYLADRRCRTFKDKTCYAEVVQCKNCKKWLLDVSCHTFIDAELHPVGLCKYTRRYTADCDFCSYGERKTENT